MRNFFAVILLMCAATFAIVLPYDTTKVFTADERAAALKAIEASELPEPTKKYHSDYVKFCIKFTAEEIGDADYSALRKKVGDTPEELDKFDFMLLMNYALQNPPVINSYFADKTIDDVNASFRKFIYIPSYNINNLKKFDTKLVKEIIIYTLNSKATATKRWEKNLIAACYNYIKLSRELPREEALDELKELKRAAYKYLPRSAAWKAFLTDLELEIQGLQ